MSSEDQPWPKDDQGLCNGRSCSSGSIVVVAVAAAVAAAVTVAMVAVVVVVAAVVAGMWS